MRASVCSLVVLVASAAALTCPPADHPRFQCSVGTMFIIDATSHTGSVDNINIMFDYLESRILPYFGFINYQNAYIAVMGSNKDGFGSSSQYNHACHEAELLRQDAIYHGLQNVSLSDSLQRIFKDLGEEYDEPVILFTANDNVNEINEAADMIRSQYSNSEFTIVAFNSPYRSWRYFHTFGFYETSFDKLFDMKYLDSCILSYSCRQVEDYCEAKYVPSNTTHVPYTIKPTFPNPQLAPFQCSCEAEKIWNDVAILMDVSFNEGFGEMHTTWQYMQKSFSQFNIQKTNFSDQHYMRVGVITYSSTVNLAHPLGSLSRDDLVALPPPKPYGSDADVTKAILAAMQLFSSDNARNNSRKTIVIFGSDFTGDEVALNAAKNQFIQNGGTIIVYDAKGDLNPALYELGQVIPPRDNGTQMTTAMCAANCFCPRGYTSYFNEDNGSPDGGCYKVLSVSNKVLGNRLCKQTGGYLAIDENPSKTQFFYQNLHLDSKSQYWLGLTYDLSTKSYAWPNNDTISTTYHPWSSFRMPPPDNMNCVTMLNQQWLQSDCRQSFSAICEAPPCDSKNYCSN